ncbi:ribonuclease-like [Arapaima gigas]
MLLSQSIMLNIWFSIPALFLVLTLAHVTTCKMSSDNLQPSESPYQKFLRQHYASAMSTEKCDIVIKQRKIYGNEETHSCKKVNTFIVKTTKKNLMNVCLKDGKIYNNKQDLYISNKMFSLITCKLKGNSQKPPCNYRGTGSYQRIVIACKAKLPVHFERAISLSGLNSSNVPVVLF